MNSGKCVNSNFFLCFCLEVRIIIVPLQKSNSHYSNNEYYFTKKFQEEGRYIIGKWWDRKGENEIDLIVVDPIGKEAWIYELKKQGYRYKENEFREKVDRVLEQTPELRKMTIHMGSLSLEDM